MKSYIVQKIVGRNINVENIWESISKIEIDSFPWDVNGYKPKSEVQMFYTDEYFKLRFLSQEKNVKVTYLTINEPVYEDSCMEFFLMPRFQCENKYINFEFNAFGNLLLGIGNSRDNRSSIVVDKDLFEIKTSLNPKNINEYEGDLWTVEFKIPFDFIKKYYGEINFNSGHRMKANFYKCGDETEYPHFGCWNAIINENPNFHLPQFFGDLILE